MEVLNLSQHSLAIAVSWWIFCALWAAKAIVSRWNRKYAFAKQSSSKNKIFKPVSYVVFFFQLFIPICFWFDSYWLFKFHDSNTLRLIGLILSFTGLGIYLTSLKFLGRNYSTCFDSHLPHELISGGPYYLIRHPMWLAKIIVSVGGIIVSGSAWLVPVLVWIIIEMRKIICLEEDYLCKQFPDYESYRSRTWSVLPFVY